MKPLLKISILFIISTSFACLTKTENKRIKEIINAEYILGNPNYTAISFGGYREKTRDKCPSVEELKEDMKILSAIDIKIIRTYYTQQFPHAERVLQAIQELKKEKPSFEMYVMLGAWIECEGAYTSTRNHAKENVKGNQAEVKRAIELAKEYPKIIKILAVGNESMVHWAETYSVYPKVILKYVEQLQNLKKQGELSSDLWITSSDNFASWGGGSTEYYSNDLIKLIKAVDYVSMHTYPFHDTHYNPEFWQIDSTDLAKSRIQLAQEGVLRAKNYAISQYESTKKYIHSIAPSKPIHIGETGWANSAFTNYGVRGSHAADEYKQKLYYDHMREWSNENGLSCFFFEAFDEPWKDTNDVRASENHFGLINIKGEAKYVLWSLVDSGKLKGLIRNGNFISKTYNGNEEQLLKSVQAPPTKSKKLSI
ncbi:MAG: exo-beta-1,3-glucanase (GH17 family) [Vicingaceae bacterium]|jgi:exo-beta-1,3-glucanase (GH17 family)